MCVHVQTHISIYCIRYSIVLSNSSSQTASLFREEVLQYDLGSVGHWWTKNIDFTLRQTVYWTVICDRYPGVTGSRYMTLVENFPDMKKQKCFLYRIIVRKM